MTGGSVGSDKGRVFLFDYAKVVALDGGSGAVLWQHTAAVLPRYSPAIARGTLYYHDDYHAFGLETTGGTQTWMSVPFIGCLSGSSGGNAMAIGLEYLIVPNRGFVHAYR